MPNILKRFLQPKVTEYEYPEQKGSSDFSHAVFETASVEEVINPSDALPLAEDTPLAAAEQDEVAEPSALDFAKVQADAIVEAARSEAASLKAEALALAAEEIAAKAAAGRDEGFLAGYQEGLAKAMLEAEDRHKQQAQALALEVKHFLDRANLVRDELLRECQGELKDLSVAVAEKVIRISLKSSGEVISRLILRATEKLSRKEWVHIYIAGSDAKLLAQSSPHLNLALGALSDHVKIIPLPEEESGTCMIEMPDEIIDASVSTQLSNIRDVLIDPY